MITVRPQIKPRAVFCVVENAHRDDALAEAICAGCFTHAGVTLDFGQEADSPDWPDWLTAELPADEEWRIEWSKFYYGLDLAHVFRETGDAKFLRAWEQLVRSWIRQVPVSFDSSDVTGRRIQNWIYAWNSFASAPAFTGLAENLDEQIIESLALQVHHLRTHLSAERNHRTLELYALLIAALALPELDADGSLLDFSITELHRNLLTDVRSDGTHREASTHYHMTVLRSFLGARENARRFGLFFPDGYDARLERACEFALHCHRPDGAIPALSDSDTGSYVDLLELAASLFARPDFLYAATAGARGVAPQQQYISFPDGGYYIQRGGWGEKQKSGVWSQKHLPCALTPDSRLQTPDSRLYFKQERFLIFDCGPLGDGGHGHYDLLNVEIAAAGRPLVVDPGRYTYAEGPTNWRKWFKGTAAHNTVCVDGLDQTPYRRGKPKGPVAQGRLLRRLSAPGFDMLCGEARSPAYEVVHTRRIFFIADEYWLIVDRLRGERPHRFDLRFHLTPEAWEQTETAVSEDNFVVRAPGLALIFAPSHRPRIEPGWVAPRYGVKFLSPVVSVRADEATEADFFTLVVPLGPDNRPPTLRVHPHQVDASQATTVEVSGTGLDGSATDHVAWSETVEPFELEPFKERSVAAWLRASAEGTTLALRAFDTHGGDRVSGNKGKLFADARYARMRDERYGLQQNTWREL